MELAANRKQINRKSGSVTHSHQPVKKGLNLSALNSIPRLGVFFDAWKVNNHYVIRIAFRIQLEGTADGPGRMAFHA
jgi:hypothetical protein